MPETVLNIPKKIASPRMGRMGSNKVNITRNTYTNLSDNDYEQEITVDDDLVFTASGRELSLLGTYIYRFLCTVTLGLFYLWCRWNIATLIYIKTIKCPLRLATHICIINQWGKVSLVPVNRVLFNGSLESVFPTFASRHPEHSSEIIQNISSYEYRYFRFLLNPRTGIFEPNYSWYNPKWKSVNAILSGYEHLSQEDIQRQRLLFGQNHVEIAEKSTLQLLIDEVLHPFFIFQIFSILLWSIDEYYYYATAILLITVSSSTVTLVNFVKVARNKKKYLSSSINEPFFKPCKALEKWSVDVSQI
jgi:cation-transporting ATPase 13A2